jgi:pyrimidine-nucleoside phosphorylase
MSMHVPTLLEKKRDGAELSRDEIQFLIDAFTRGEIPDSILAQFKVKLKAEFQEVTPISHRPEAIVARSAK